jgi:ABC-type transport system substrate-binding protein
MKFLYIGLFFLLLMVVSSQAAQVTAADEPDRENVFWQTGHHQGGINCNPFSGDIGVDTMWSFEPLFDYDYENNRLLKHLGETIEWDDNGETIIITLRDGITWTGGSSDGEDITADDVVYTYEKYGEGRLAGDFNVSNPDAKVDELEAEDDTTVVVTLNEDYAYSMTVWEHFIGQNGIVCKAAFEDMEDEGLNIHGFNFDWIDEESEIDEDWQTVSGPYLQYYESDTEDRKVYEKNEDWWGANVDEFKADFEACPDYVGHRLHPSNSVANEALENDEIDLSAAYVPLVGDMMERNPKVGTWLAESPYYLSLSSMCEIILNHNQFPFSELWFRQVLAYCIDYDNINAVGGNYLTRAKMGAIDNNSPRWEQFFDPEVEDEYNIDDYSVADSLEVLADNCLPNSQFRDYVFPADTESGDHEKGDELYDGDMETEEFVAGWYTKDIDTEIYDESDWTDYNIADAVPTDADVDGSDGINVKLGPYVLKVPDGWSDFDLQVSAITLDIQNGIGIACTPELVDWVGFTTSVGGVGDENDMTYSPMSPKLLETPIRFLNYMQGAGNSLWGNSSCWNKNTTPDAEDYVDALTDFDVAEPESDEQLEAASTLQELIAKNMPNIFTFPNGYWYTFNEAYWTGFQTESDHDFQITTVWSTANYGLVQRMILRLRPASEEKASPLPLVPILLGLAAAGVLVMWARKKRD